MLGRKNNGCVAVLVAAVCSAVVQAAPQGESAPSLSGPRANPAAIRAPNGDLWVVGGLYADSSPPPSEILSSVEILAYDRANLQYAPTWQPGPSLPEPRMGHCMAVSGRFIYVISGRSGPAFEPLGVLRYDTLGGAGTWVSIAPLQTPRCDAGAVVDSWGRVWVIGGIIQGVTTVAAVEYYDPLDPATGWQIAPSLPGPRAYPGAAVDAQGRILIFGGSIAGTGIVYTDVFRLDPADPAGGWTEISDIPEAPSPQAACALGANGSVYMPGGWLPGFTDRVLRYEPLKACWEYWAPPLLLARNNHAVVLGHDKRLYVIAGNSYEEWPTSSVERLWTGNIVGDINEDGTVDFGDINPLVDLLTNGDPCDQ